MFMAVLIWGRFEAYLKYIHVLVLSLYSWQRHPERSFFFLKSFIISFLRKFVWQKRNLLWLFRTCQIKVVGGGGGGPKERSTRWSWRRGRWRDDGFYLSLFGVSGDETATTPLHLMQYCSRFKTFPMLSLKRPGKISYIGFQRRAPKSPLSTVMIDVLLFYSRQPFPNKAFLLQRDSTGHVGIPSCFCLITVISALNKMLKLA